MEQRMDLRLSDICRIAHAEFTSSWQGLQYDIQQLIVHLKVRNAYRLQLLLTLEQQRQHLLMFEEARVNADRFDAEVEVLLSLLEEFIEALQMALAKRDVDEEECCVDVEDELGHGRLETLIHKLGVLLHPYLIVLILGTLLYLFELLVEYIVDHSVAEDVVEVI